MENHLGIYIDNTYSNNPIPSHSSFFPNINHNQHYIMNAPTIQNSNAPLYTQPTVSVPTQQDHVFIKHGNAIWNLSEQLSKEN